MTARSGALLALRFLFSAGFLSAGFLSAGLLTAGLLGASLLCAGAPAQAAAAPTHQAPAKPAKPPPPPAPPAAPPPADIPGQQRDEGTLEVTADHDLEWLQQDHVYIARGNAVAKRGAVTLMGDTIIAYYRPLAKPNGVPGQPAPVQAVSAQAAPVQAGPTQAGPVQAGPAPQPGIDSSNTEIWRVVAEGHVHILSGDRDAFGDRAEYDKDKAVMVLTGAALKASSLTDVVTARDSLEYWDDLDMAVARGNALIVRVNGNQLAGDVIAGHFVKDAQGQKVLKTISAKGHVVVTTLTDIVHGDEGTDDLDTKRTVLFGNVKATRGQSEIEGQSAEVNMETGISQVFPGPDQRVHALFVRSNIAEAAQPAPGTAPAAGTKH